MKPSPLFIRNQQRIVRHAKPFTVNKQTRPVYIRVHKQNKALAHAYAVLLIIAVVLVYGYALAK